MSIKLILATLIITAALGAFTIGMARDLGWQRAAKLWAIILLLAGSGSFTGWLLATGISETWP